MQFYFSYDVEITQSSPLLTTPSHPPVSRTKPNASRGHQPPTTSHHIVAIMGDTGFYKFISDHIGDDSAHLVVHYAQMFAGNVRKYDMVVYDRYHIQQADRRVQNTGMARMGLYVVFHCMVRVHCTKPLFSMGILVFTATDSVPIPSTRLLARSMDVLCTQIHQWDRRFLVHGHHGTIQTMVD